MNKPEVTESGLPISGLLRQAAAFVRDFAAFAGLSGVVASVLAVLAASFEGVGLLLLVPLLSLITASDAGTGWTHRFLTQAFKAMLDLKPRPTIVMIAHRDQSLASCDHMLRLQNGRALADEPALTG